VAVIRTYFGAVAYEFPSWQKLVSFELPPQRQGESITAPPSGDEVWIGSEGPDSRVIAVPLPDLEPREPNPPSTSAPPTTTTEQVSSPGQEQLKEAARAVLVFASVALVLLILVGAFLYRRHQPHD
jgi:hypothetical protein